jgi:hypothetical protein
MEGRVTIHAALKQIQTSPMTFMPEPKMIRKDNSSTIFSRYSKSDKEIQSPDLRFLHAQLWQYDKKSLKDIPC